MYRGRAWKGYCQAFEVLLLQQRKDNTGRHSPAAQSVYSVAQFEVGKENLQCCQWSDVYIIFW